MSDLAIELQQEKDKNFDDSQYFDELSDEFADQYDVKFPLQQDEKGKWYQVIQGEEGMEREDVEEKFYPILNRFI